MREICSLLCMTFRLSQINSNVLHFQYKKIESSVGASSSSSTLKSNDNKKHQKAIATAKKYSKHYTTNCLLISLILTMTLKAI